MKALKILQEQYNMLSKDIDGVWIDPEKIDEAIKELEDLSTKDKLAELEKLLLDFFSKTYGKNKHGLCGWTFDIEIKSYYGIKVLKIYFVDNHSNIDKFFELKAETTKEMFDKTLEHFYSI